MDRTRRVVLHSMMAAGGLGLILSSGLLITRQAFAELTEDAFKADTPEKALANVVGEDESPEESTKIDIKVPEIAENGAVVPVTISTTLPNVTSISIIVPGNPTPLTSVYDIYPRTEPFVSTRIKMAKTSTILAVVKSGNKNYSASREIKVTIGGCGG